MAKAQAKRTAPVRKPATPAPATQGDTPDYNWRVIVPVAAAALFFALGLGNEMTGLDDHASTVENPAVTSFAPDTVFTNFNLGMYAPITWIGYAIAYALGKDSAFWYHLLSWGVHVFNTWLLCKLLERMPLRSAIALPVALLFAIHPIQVESVAWIAGFSTPLFSMFSLLGFNAYLQFSDETQQKTKFYLLTLLFFVLACLSKSAAVTFPLTLAVIDWWRRPEGLTLQKQAIRYAPFFLIAIGFGLLTIYTREVSGTMVGESANGYSAFERVLLVCYAPLFYIVKILLPFKLNVYYSFDRVNGALPIIYYLAPFGILLLGVLAWVWRKSAPYFWIGLAFFASNIVIVLPFASLGTFELCADHYNYLASIGIFYLLAEGAAALKQRLSGQSALITGVAGIWIALVAISCVRQVRIWKDTLTVITNAIDNGYSHRGMMFLGRGTEMADKGRFPDAINDFSKAIEQDPTMREAYRSRGSLYAQAGQIDLALKDMEIYLKYDSVDVVTWNNLAQIYYRQGKLPKALQAFNKTIELKPDAAMSYQSRAKVYEMLGDTARMRADLNQARAIAQSKKQGE